MAVGNIKNRVLMNNLMKSSSEQNENFWLKTKNETLEVFYFWLFVSQYQYLPSSVEHTFSIFSQLKGFQMNGNFLGFYFLSKKWNKKPCNHLVPIESNEAFKMRKIEQKKRPITNSLKNNWSNLDQNWSK